MNWFVVRYGQTEWNVLKKMQGWADIPLNDKVIEQVYQNRENLKDINVDIIFCSPLIRAWKTAEIINSDKNIKIIFYDRLIEKNYGEFEGISKASFDYNEFWSYNKNLNYVKAENIQMFFDRIYKFIDELKLKYSNKNVLVVTHAGIIKVIECYVNSMMSDEEIGPFLPNNCSVIKYVI